MRKALPVLLLVAGCRDPAEARDMTHRAPVADRYRAGMSTERARHVRTIIGFNDPESVRYDPDQDVFFVSNVAGLGSARDGNGYIVRIAAGRMDSVGVFIRSGDQDVPLHAPKGMALQGDTLWVTDIDVVRGFHRRTGEPIGHIDFSQFGPVQLNDIAVGGDGSMRVTDTGIHMVYEGNVHTGPDRLFAVSAGRRVSVVVQDSSLHLPNGVAWDSAGRRWYVASFDRHAGEIWSPRAGTATRRDVVRRGKGQLDGLEVLSGGRLIFSSWADSSVRIFDGRRDVAVVRQLHEPADIGIDTRRGRVLIPLSVIGHVQVWDLGPWWTDARR